jgi:hypothetical protein
MVNILKSRKDDLKELKRKIQLQRGTIEEFENYLIMLTNIVQNAGGEGYTTQIKNVTI